MPNHMLYAILGFPAGTVITPIWHRRPEVFPQAAATMSSMH